MAVLTRYLKLLEATRPTILVATGPAGTSKTYSACHVGIRRVQAGQYDRLVLTRPAVSAGEDLGYLPGTLEEKMLPWIQPCIDAIGHPAFKKLSQSGKIEICPIAYMRGRTFENCFIVADEMQNATQSQVLMALTRIGFDSKLIVTGDLNQMDNSANGLGDLVWRVKNRQSSDLIHIEFDETEIRRHPVVKEVLDLYVNKNNTQ